MVMQIRRKADDSLLSDQVQFFEGWKIRRGKKLALETVNGVTYFQQRGRREWIGPTTFLFCDLLSTSTIDNMWLFMKMADDGEWFLFTDKWGDTYDVRVHNEMNPEREENSGIVPVFYVEAHLLMRGFE